MEKFANKRIRDSLTLAQIAPNWQTFNILEYLKELSNVKEIKTIVLDLLKTFQSKA